MNKYNNGKIYKLYSKKTDNIYIGSTYLTLKERLRCHFKDYERYLKNNNNYITSYEILKYDDCKIELIVDYPCDSKKDLEKEEGKYQKILNCVNKLVAGRTRQEYRQDNIDKYKEYYKQYYENNKENITDYHKQYYQNNKDKIKNNRKKQYENNKENELIKMKNYRDNNKEKIKDYHKQYYENNKEKVLMNMKEKYEKNKNEINIKRTQKIKCECGKSISKCNIAIHKKSKIHKKLLNIE
jgi:hypothetical protein